MYYKVLSPDGRSFNGGSFQYDLPKQQADGSYLPGDWHSVTPPVVLCETGFHLTDAPYAWTQWDSVIYEAEGAGASIADPSQYKTAFERVRLLRPVAHEAWWDEAHAFVSSLKHMPWLQPDGQPDPAWRLFTGESWNAARDAARDAALDAAGNAASYAALDAARDAAWDAARDAAWSAAGNAASYAALDAARDAAWDAARDAALYVRTEYICRGTTLEQKHIDHARARWNVWQKGYVLLCDVDGVLYVYAKA